jgi:hypothetical protein
VVGAWWWGEAGPAGRRQEDGWGWTDGGQGEPAMGQQPMEETGGREEKNTMMANNEKPAGPPGHMRARAWDRSLCR